MGMDDLIRVTFKVRVEQLSADGSEVLLVFSSKINGRAIPPFEGDRQWVKIGTEVKLGVGTTLANLLADQQRRGEG